MMHIKENSVGLVETKFFTYDGKMKLESGKELGPFTLSYETYGQLNEDKSNVVLIEHALTGDAHAAGWHKDDRKPGWWESMIGPKKAFDTEQYFIICSNVLGGCKGSTGPSSINPDTNKPYGLKFPVITIFDMIQAQKHLLDSLGVDKLLCVVGGSMGGMQSLAWASLYPDMIKGCIPIACTYKHSPQQIAFSEVGRQAVMADPAWNKGDYYDENKPEKGLALARMIGHITYMSDKSMEVKFARRLKESKYAFEFSPEFEVEGYLRYQGEKFVKRFDANSYLYMTKAIDYFDLAEGDNESIAVSEAADIKFMVIGFKSDWLYPVYQSQDIARQLKIKDIDVTYCEIESSYGHDAFLLEVDEQSHLIKHFLKRLYKDK